MSYLTMLDVAEGDTSIVPLSLFSDVFYSYTAVLEQKTYTIKILWTSNNEGWNFSLYDEDEEPLLVNKALSPMFPIDPTISSGLQGYFLLVPIADNAKGKWEQLKWELQNNYYFVYVTKTTLL